MSKRFFSHVELCTKRLVLAICLCCHLVLNKPIFGQDLQLDSWQEQMELIQRSIDSLRIEMDGEESIKTMAEQQYEQAQRDIQQAIEMGRTPVTEQFMASDALREKRRAESKISRLTFEIQQQQGQLRRLESQRSGSPGNPPEPGPPTAPVLPKDLQALQGNWVSYDGRETLRIQGDRIFITWQVGEELGRVQGKVLVDGSKAHLDFHLGDLVVRHLYELEIPKDGSAILHTQFNPMHPEVRLHHKRPEFECELGQNSQMYKLAKP